MTSSTLLFTTTAHGTTTGQPLDCHKDIETPSASSTACLAGCLHYDRYRLRCHRQLSHAEGRWVSLKPSDPWLDSRVAPLPIPDLTLIHRNVASPTVLEVRVR